MSEAAQEAHPYAEEDAVNTKVYDVARQIDKILHRQPVENHAAILGLVQVTSQRRMHEVQTRQQKIAHAQQAEAQRTAKFSPN